MTFKPYCDVCNTWHTESEPHVRVSEKPTQISDLRTEIMRLIREEFDPTPSNWERREWHDNAEDTADKILGAIKIANCREIAL